MLQRRATRRLLPARNRVRRHHPQKRYFDPVDIEDGDDDDEEVEIGGGSMDEKSQSS